MSRKHVHSPPTNSTTRPPNSRKSIQPVHETRIYVYGLLACVQMQPHSGLGGACVAHVTTMDANGQWRAHGAPMHTMQTFAPASKGYLYQLLARWPFLGPKCIRGGTPERGGRLDNLARSEDALSVTQTYTWRITTPYAIACYLPDASTRNHTGAERGADLTSIASCAARRLAPTRMALCPDT